MFRIHHIHHLDEETVRVIWGFHNQLYNMEMMIMAISSQVQAVLDAIAQNSSLVASVDAGLKAESAQITDLQAQVAALQAQVAAGGVLSADDVAALAAGLAQLNDTNARLQADVPANTTATPTTTTGG